MLGSAKSGNLRLFAVTLVAVLLAEMGDKTQLTALAFTADTPGYRWIIFAAAAGAMTLTSLIGVLVGDLLARLLKPRALNIIAGSIFIACAVLFGLKFVLGQGAAAAAEPAASTAGVRTPWEAFGLTFVAIFIAELGDKTQLATLSLAAGNRRARWVVFAGSALALTAASALACLVGGAVGDRIRSGYVTLGAAALFLVLGVAFLLGRAEKGRREFAWLAREIGRLYEDARCRRCGRFMRFLRHVDAVGSVTVSRAIADRLLPEDEWERSDCDRACKVDAVHTGWHDRWAHDDDEPAPPEKG